MISSLINNLRIRSHQNEHSDMDVCEMTRIGEGFCKMITNRYPVRTRPDLDPQRWTEADPTLPHTGYNPPVCILTCVSRREGLWKVFPQPGCSHRSNLGPFTLPPIVVVVLKVALPLYSLLGRILRERKSLVDIRKVFHPFQ